MVYCNRWWHIERTILHLWRFHCHDLNHCIDKEGVSVTVLAEKCSKSRRSISSLKILFEGVVRTSRCLSLGELSPEFAAEFLLLSQLGAVVSRTSLNCRIISCKSCQSLNLCYKLRTRCLLRNLFPSPSSLWALLSCSILSCWLAIIWLAWTVARWWVSVIISRSFILTWSAQVLVSEIGFGLRVEKRCGLGLSKGRCNTRINEKLFTKLSLSGPAGTCKSIVVKIALLWVIP